MAKSAEKDQPTLDLVLNDNNFKSRDQLYYDTKENKIFCHFTKFEAK